MAFFKLIGLSSDLFIFGSWKYFSKDFSKYPTFYATIFEILFYSYFLII
jgi:hypothetical protein